MTAREIATPSTRGRVMRVWLQLELAAWRHGVLWPVALLLALAAVVLHQGVTARATQLRSEARASLASEASRSRAGGTVPDAGDAAAFDRLSAVLRADRDLDDEVRELYAIAAASRLPIGAARFSGTDDSDTGLRRLAISLPVTARYGEVRKFIDAALLQLPNLSIDEVSLTGGKSLGAPLDIHLRLSLWARPQDGLQLAVHAYRPVTGGR